MADKLPLYTIGHSNRSLDALLAVLADAGIQRLVDVRTFPRSRTHPQFNIEVLPASLAEAGMAYEYVPELGGRRRKSADVAPDVNAFWRVAGFHNYADHAMSPAFQQALDALLATSERKRSAIMCSEVLWWRCHRRIITDYALAAGRNVVHLFDVGHAEPARMTPAAVALPGGVLAYPREGDG